MDTFWKIITIIGAFVAMYLLVQLVVYLAGLVLSGYGFFVFLGIGLFCLILYGLHRWGVF